MAAVHPLQDASMFLSHLTTKGNSLPLNHQEEKRNQRELTSGRGPRNPTFQIPHEGRIGAHLKKTWEVIATEPGF